MRRIWLDVETTGLDPQRHSIVQLAGLVEVNGEVAERFNFRMAPIAGREVDAKALEVNGIDLEYARTLPNHWEIFTLFAHKMRECAGRDGLIVPAGHCVEFDLAFIREYEKLHSIKLPFHHRVCDTAVLAHALIEAGILPTPNAKLKTLAKYLSIAYEPHDAEEDARAAMEAWDKMISIINHRPVAA